MKEITIQIPNNCELVKEGDVYKIKELSYPKTWEEYCNMYPDVVDEYYISSYSSIMRVNKSYRSYVNDRKLLSTREEAKAFLALMQLRRLREAYIKYFNYDYITKHCCRIAATKDGNLYIVETDLSSPLSFPNIGIAEIFLTNFKDLLETAKMLL